MAAAWALADERSDATEEVLDRGTDDGMIVPTLFWFEIRNLLVMQARRNRITPEQRTRFLHGLDRLPLQIDRHPSSSDVIELAERHRLSAYDAAYLELSLRLGRSLATLDRRLATAAGAEGVPVLPRR